MTKPGKPADPLPRLLPNAAFVVQLGTAIDAQTGAAAGRVEHVSSGRAARFMSISEMLAFMQSTLAEQDIA